MRRGWGIVQQVGRHLFSVRSCVLSLHDYGTQHKIPGYDNTYHIYLQFLSADMDFVRQRCGLLALVWHCIYLGGGAKCRNETARRTDFVNSLMNEEKNINHDSYKQNPPSLNAFIQNYSLQYPSSGQTRPVIASEGLIRPAMISHRFSKARPNLSLQFLMLFVKPQSPELQSLQNIIPAWDRNIRSPWIYSERVPLRRLRVQLRCAGCRSRQSESANISPQWRKSACRQS